MLRLEHSEGCVRRRDKQEPALLKNQQILQAIYLIPWLTSKTYRDIMARDEADTKRKHSPLRKADDAIEIDSTNLTLMEQIRKIEQLARAKM